MACESNIRMVHCKRVSSSANIWEVSFQIDPKPCRRAKGSFTFKMRKFGEAPFNTTKDWTANLTTGQTMFMNERYELPPNTEIFFEGIVSHNCTCQ